MADQVVLLAEGTRETGTRPNRRLRRTGRIPGVVYGLESAPTSISVDYREARAALSGDAGLNALLNLQIDGGSEIVLVKELQRHAVKDEVIHIDFIRVDPNKEIEVDVPVVLVGEAKQVAQESGMVDQLMFSLSVYSLPTAIPNELEIDITELTVGSALHVSDLVLPDGVRTEVDPEESIALGTVTRSTLDAIRAEEEAAAAAEAAELGDGAPAAGGDDADGGDDD